MTQQVVDGGIGMAQVSAGSAAAASTKRVLLVPCQRIMRVSSGLRRVSEEEVKAVKQRVMNHRSQAIYFTLKYK